MSQENAHSDSGAPERPDDSPSSPADEPASERLIRRVEFLTGHHMEGLTRSKAQEIIEGFRDDTEKFADYEHWKNAGEPELHLWDRARTIGGISTFLKVLGGVGALLILILAVSFWYGFSSPKDARDTAKKTGKAAKEDHPSQEDLPPDQKWKLAKKPPSRSFDTTTEPATTPYLGTNSREAQQRAMIIFPALGIADSPLNREFVKRYYEYQHTQPEYFDNPEWPTKLAAECAQSLNPNNPSP